MQGTMKCGVYYGIGKVGVEERDIPQIGEADVLVKVLRAGICGSDIGAFVHGGARYGVFDNFVFGHELVGRVVERGGEVPEEIELGALVFVDPSKARRAGKILADVAGAFAEYMLVEQATVDENIYLLDPDTDPGAAVIIEPLAVGTRGALSAEPALDDNVVVLGAGTIGLCAAAGLINHGIKNVAVVDCVAERLQIAERLGATPINTTQTELREALVERFGPAASSDMHPEYLPDVLKEMFAKLAAAGRVGTAAPEVALFVDCAGAEPLLLQSLGLGRDGTKYSIVSVYDKPLPIPGGIFMKQPIIRGSAGYTVETFKEVIEHVEHKNTCIADIVTARYRIDDFAEAMDAAVSKESGNIKVIIDFEL